MSSQNLAARTTSELVADRIRNAIIVGEFEDGQALKQDLLAEQYSVSKIPIREALNQLKSEGLVTFQNNRGSIVSSLSSVEIEEIYTMRIALETIALERAIPRLKLCHKVSAESALKLIEGSRDSLDWSELNWRFHASIYKAAEMPILLETVARLHNNVSRYLLLYLKEMNFQSVSQAEHWEMLEACNTGNTKFALSILRKHLKGARSLTLDYMNQ